MVLQRHRWKQARYMTLVRDVNARDLDSDTSSGEWKLLNDIVAGVPRVMGQNLVRFTCEFEFYPLLIGASLTKRSPSNPTIKR